MSEQPKTRVVTWEQLDTTVELLRDLAQTFRYMSPHDEHVQNVIDAYEWVADNMEYNIETGRAKVAAMKN